MASSGYLSNALTQVTGTIVCVFFLELCWNTDAGAACQLRFRSGSTIEIESYEDHGDSISYSCCGGVVTVPKAVLSDIEDFIPAAPPEVKADFSIVERKDLSYRRITRLQFRIQVAEYATELDLRGICEQIIAREMKAQPLNAIEFLFYRPGTDVHRPYTAGRAYWAPNGNWMDAESVYCRHALVVTYGSAAYEVPTPPPPVAAPVPRVSPQVEYRPAAMPRSQAEQADAAIRGADALAATQSRFPAIRRVTTARAAVVILIDPMVWGSLSLGEKQSMADEMMRAVLAGNGNIAVPIDMHDGRGRVAISVANPMRMEILR